MWPGDAKCILAHTMKVAAVVEERRCLSGRSALLSCSRLPRRRLMRRGEASRRIRRQRRRLAGTSSPNMARAESGSATSRGGATPAGTTVYGRLGCFRSEAECRRWLGRNDAFVATSTICPVDRLVGSALRGQTAGRPFPLRAARKRLKTSLSLFGARAAATGRLELSCFAPLEVRSGSALLDCRTLADVAATISG
jgi:hypothetical protein